MDVIKNAILQLVKIEKDAKASFLQFWFDYTSEILTRSPSIAYEYVIMHTYTLIKCLFGYKFSDFLTK